MHPSLDKEKLIGLVLKHTEPLWVGVIGSAAHGGENFTLKSDVDLLVLHEDDTKFILDEINSRIVEIAQYSVFKMEMIYQNPQWFGANWLWEVGKFETAEKLIGDRPKMAVSQTNRAIAIIGALGRIIGYREKQAQGRVMLADENHEGISLRYLLDGKFPGSQLASVEHADLEDVDAIRPIIEPIIRFNYEKMLYYPEHWLGLNHLIDRWNLDIELPASGITHE
ncbi:MAG: hypothetical protein AAF423_00420 [Pseudomonadota bacterium]